MRHGTYEEMLDWMAAKLDVDSGMLDKDTVSEILQAFRQQFHGVTILEEAPEERDYWKARHNHEDRWVPACGGKERPTRYPSGRWYLYVFNPAQDKHRYLDLSTDMIIEGEPS